MNDDTRDSAAERALSGLAIAGAWSCYLPLGAKYTAVLSCAACAAVVVYKRADWARCWQAPALIASVGLLLMLALSAAWSPAPWPRIGSHLWVYSLLLWVPIIGSACPARAARRALAHFTLCSALVGVLFVLARSGVLPATPVLWHTTLNAEGNQRIATSILLAIGACLALWLGLRARGAVRGTARAAWAMAAAACVAGLTLQDRRSGMVLLPLLLLVWALVRQPGWWRRLVLAVAILLAALLAWQASDGVHARFAEGLAELRQYRNDDSVSTSWGQRLRMWEVTGAMVRDRPLAGHGVASWSALWRDRVTAGTPLALNTTPHNEYLLIAQQIGAIGVALWSWLLLAALRHAVSSGPAGVPALLVWTAIACAGLFNAVLRDAKFALPLLLLAALASAAARGEVRPSGRRGSGAAGPHFRQPSLQAAPDRPASRSRFHGA